MVRRHRPWLTARPLTGWRAVVREGVWLILGFGVGLVLLGLIIASA